MGDWSRGFGNFGIISDHNIEESLRKMLGKPFTCDEMQHGDISKERYKMIPHSKEGSLDYHINSFQIVKNPNIFNRNIDYTGHWLTEIEIYGCLKDGNNADISLEDWLMQVLTKFSIYEDNCGNYNYFKWSDDYSEWETWYTVHDGIISKHDCPKSADAEIEYRNSFTWDGTQWIPDEED